MNEHFNDSLPTDMGASEQTEAVDVRDINYIQIDDQPFMHELMRGALEEEMEIKNRLGEARSVEEALELVRFLAEQKTRLDLIILDQRFYLTRDGAANQSTAAQEFIEGFRKLLENSAYQTLKRAQIILYSGSATDRDVARLAQVVPNVIGKLEKPGTIEKEGENFSRLVSLLAQRGIIKRTHEVIAAEKRLEKFQKTGEQ